MRVGPAGSLERFFSGASQGECASCSPEQGFQGRVGMDLRAGKQQGDRPPTFSPQWLCNSSCKAAFFFGDWSCQIKGHPITVEDGGPPATSGGQLMRGTWVTFPESSSAPWRIHTRPPGGGQATCSVRCLQVEAQ